MEPLGSVKTISSKGHLIVAASAMPNVGDTVSDERARKIGRVIRVFGPVSGPYVAVLPLRGMEKDLLRLVGRKVFKSGRERREGRYYAKKKRGR